MIGAVAPSRPPERLDQIIDAAIGVFEAKGFRQARMADIARAAGVSPGLLYTYAVSKDALFHVALARELGAEVDVDDLPIVAPDAASTERLATVALTEITALPTLDAALEIDEPDDARRELSSIVADHYDRINRYRRFIRLAERSARGWTEMADAIYADNRAPYVGRLERYIAARVGTGHFRPVPDPAVAARFVVETIAWFGMHRYGDYDGARIDDDVARATVVQLLTDALVPERHGRRRR